MEIDAGTTMLVEITATATNGVTLMERAPGAIVAIVWKQTKRSKKLIFFYCVSCVLPIDLKLDIFTTQDLNCACLYNVIQFNKVKLLLL